MSRNDSIQKLVDGILLLEKGGIEVYDYYMAISQQSGVDPDISSLATDIALYANHRQDADVPKYFFDDNKQVVEAISRLVRNVDNE